MPVLIKSLFHKEIEVRFLPASFQMNPIIENRFSFYRTFRTNCKTLTKLFSLFNIRIGKNKEGSAIWARFIVIDGSQMVIIFKKEDNANMKGFLYLDSVKNGTDRASELLIQTLSSEN